MAREGNGQTGERAGGDAGKKIARAGVGLRIYFVVHFSASERDVFNPFSTDFFFLFILILRRMGKNSTDPRFFPTNYLESV